METEYIVVSPISLNFFSLDDSPQMYKFLLRIVITVNGPPWICIFYVDQLSENSHYWMKSLKAPKGQMFKK